MLYLIIGLILFTGIHLLLSAAPGGRNALHQRLGEGPTKGLVALASFGGIALIVIGWRSVQPEWLYVPPSGLRHFASLLAAIGVYLFIVSNRPSVIKRYLRHPQLTGVFLWCVAHLLLNGDSRSLTLFGCLGAWCLLEILFINKRDGAWEKPEAPSIATDIGTAVVAVIVIFALIWAHPWFAGMPAVTGL